MNNVEQKPDNLQQAGTSKSLFRMIGIILALDVSAFVAGFAFFAITHGAIVGIMWSAPYWEFSRNIFAKATGFSDTNILLAKKQVTWQIRIDLLFKAASVIALFVVGLWLLISNGFCGQNLICLAYR